MVNKRKSRWQLYVLELEQGKWCIGITSRSVEKRFREHKRGFAGANWTKKYRPLKIHDMKDLGLCDIEKAQLYEGRVTRKYMEQYGDNNVRGGDLTDVGDYVRRFGRIFTRENWGILSYIIFMQFVCLYLLIDLYVLRPSTTRSEERR